MRRRRARCRCCHGLPLFLSLIGVTVVGYGLLLALHQPLVQLDLVPNVFHGPTPAAVTDVRPSRGHHVPATALSMDEQSLCAGRLVAYGRQFAKLTNAVIDRRLCRSEREGGEPIDAVINQPESVEYYYVDRGCFRLACPSNSSVASSRVDYAFAGAQNHLNTWLLGLQLTGDDSASTDVDARPRFTVAVTRYEYANLYHTMTDWYNSFLMLCFFNETSDSTDILFVDSHPRGALDPVWRRLFRRTTRLSDLPSDRPSSFRQLVWGWLGYNSLMTVYQSSPAPPLIEEFRDFFLSAYGLSSAVTTVRGPQPDCAGMRLSILFIWRRDYVAHPRNPRGSVTRKIANEDELLRRVSSQLPDARVRGVQIDLYSMDEQLRLILDADILIGMHGAGLTHALFLRSTSALIELFPSYWSAGEHFAAIASWRQLIYMRWVNNDLTLERPDGQSTVVPPTVVTALVRNAVRRLCPSASPIVADESSPQRTSTPRR